MKTISALRKLINFYFYLLTLGFIIVTIILPVLFYQDKVDKLTIFDELDFSNLHLGEFLIIMFFVAIIYFQFIKAIYLLKKCLNDLSNGKYFSELVITNFNKIGKLFLFCGIGFSVLKFVLRILLLNDIKIGLDNSLIFSIIVGLFFMFLSEAFKKAGNLEEENELTI